MITRECLGTWETLPFPSSKAAGVTADQLQSDPRYRVRDRGGRTTDATMVSPSEGNEVRRDGGRESERLVVPTSRGNYPNGPRGGKGTPFHESPERNMTGTPRPDTVYTKRRRIAKLAKDCPDMSFTNLAHHIDIAWLHEAYVKTRKDGAVGVDGQTADEYEADLWGNLQHLLDRTESGTYVAPPVRRVHIPKAGSPGETHRAGDSHVRG